MLASTPGGNSLTSFLYCKEAKGCLAPPEVEAGAEVEAVVEGFGAGAEEVVTGVVFGATEATGFGVSAGLAAVVVVVGFGVSAGFGAAAVVAGLVSTAFGAAVVAGLVSTGFGVSAGFGAARR